ncbi:MAG: hypothetical protein HKP40_13480 [Litoreibacter sp.]|nr:hypothetical protein [Litoreibacter sp.]
MKTRMALIILAAALAPTLASAQCIHSEQQAATCKPGTSWDAQTATCVADPTT